jgi:hypothetical protein
MSEALANNAVTTLQAAITATDTSFTLASAAAFIDPVTGNPLVGNFRVTIENEIILVGTLTGAVCSALTRGLERTTAAAHAAGVYVGQTITVLGLSQFVADRVGPGSMVPPASSVTNNLVAFSDATGKVLKDSGLPASIGTWTDVAFSAGNFTASGGTWTVTSGQQAVFAYSVLAKDLHLLLSLGSTTVTAGTTALLVKLPGTVTIAKGPIYIPVMLNLAGAWEVGLALLTAGATTVSIYRAGGAAYAAGATTVYLDLIIPLS